MPKHYGKESVIYYKQSQHNELVVTVDDGKLTLWSPERVRQSVFDLKNPAVPGLEYAKYMLLALVFIPTPASVVSIGLGGGTIPTALSKLALQCLIHVVEIDMDIVFIAKNYFGFKETPLMKLSVDDGYSFIESCCDSFDIAMLDAYKGSSQPKSLSSKTFFKNLAKTLKPEGVCVVNLITTDTENLNNAVNNMKAVFRNIWYAECKTSRNVVYFASNHSYDECILAANIKKIKELIPSGNPDLLINAKKLHTSDGLSIVKKLYQFAFKKGN
ncbi:MAG: fused MFS/spermidine synthase [Nitrospirae bacterium]|nr:fused MFS/spermidine synthase [Nitrospirota bacterium]